jgi:hypothetical protein
MGCAPSTKSVLASTAKDDNVVNPKDKPVDPKNKGADPFDKLNGKDSKNNEENKSNVKKVEEAAGSKKKADKKVEI